MYPMGSSKLTELQFTILDGMADDYEDVEQLYLYVNPNLPQVRIPLRDVVDELTRMLREGYIAIKHSNNELIAPLQPVEFTALHHYGLKPPTRERKHGRLPDACEPQR
jgi:hypothetical protein